MSTVELNYDRFVAALLEHGNIRLASEAVGISYATGRRWFQKPQIKEAFDEGRRDAIRVALSRLHEAMSAAVDALVRNLGADKPASVQVRAAQVLLEAVLRSSDLLDVDARLTALEAAQATQPEGVSLGYERK